MVDVVAPVPCGAGDRGEAEHGVHGERDAALVRPVGAEVRRVDQQRPAHRAPLTRSGRGSRDPPHGSEVGHERGRGSRQSGSRRNPAARRAALSSTECAGGGPAAGRTRSPVRIGSTRSGSCPARHQHVTGHVEPGRVALVGDVEQACGAPVDQPEDAVGQVRGHGRAAPLVVDESEGPPRHGGLVQHLSDGGNLVRAAPPRRPDHGHPCCTRSRRPAWSRRRPRSGRPGRAHGREGRSGR